MNELERWWRWYDNEKPGLERALKLLHERLNDTEKDALRCAAGFIACRLDRARLSFVTATGDIHQLRHVLAEQPAALRAMSLELCRSFERMTEQVLPEPAPARPRQPRVSDDTVDALAYGISMATRSRDEQERLFGERFLQKAYSNNMERGGYLGGGYFARPWSPHLAPVRLTAVDIAKVDL